MNIVFWFLVVIVLILAWFMLSFAYKGIGSIFKKLYDDAKDEIIGEENESEK